MMQRIQKEMEQEVTAQQKFNEEVLSLQVSVRRVLPLTWNRRVSRYPSRRDEKVSRQRHSVSLNWQVIDPLNYNDN